MSYLQDSIQFNEKSKAFVDKYGYTVTEFNKLIPKSTAADDNVLLNTQISSKIASEAPAQVAATNPINLASSAANYVKITGAASGSAPTVESSGADVNTNLIVQAKGTGTVRIPSQLSFNLGYFRGSLSGARNTNTSADIAITTNNTWNSGARTNVPAVVAPANNILFLNFNDNTVNTYNNSNVYWTTGNGNEGEGLVNNTAYTMILFVNAWVGGINGLSGATTIEMWYQIKSSSVNHRYGRISRVFASADWVEGTTSTIVRLAPGERIVVAYYAGSTAHALATRDTSNPGLELGNRQSYITIQQLA